MRTSIALIIGFCALLLGTNPVFSQDTSADSQLTHQVLTTLRTDQDATVYRFKIFQDPTLTITKVEIAGQTFNEDFVETLRRGHVINKAQGRDVVTVFAPSLDLYYGGRIELKYLSNAIFKRYKSFYMDLVREGDHFSLYTVPQRRRDKRVKINSLFIKAKKFFGIPIGIKKIEVNR